MQYRKKPVVIEAIQFKCDLVGDEGDNIKKVFSFFESFDGRQLVFVDKTELFIVKLAGHTFDIKHPFEGSNNKFDSLLNKTNQFFKTYLN